MAWYIPDRFISPATLGYLVTELAELGSCDRDSRNSLAFACSDLYFKLPPLSFPICVVLIMGTWSLPFEIFTGLCALHTGLGSPGLV